MDPTHRFSDRVDDYIKYRPSYPQAALDDLATLNILRPHSVVADIGAGTGILSQLLLTRGHSVIAVEPNDPMRNAADTALRHYPTYSSVKGAAEATTLPGASVDLVTSAQSFHWFDPPRAKQEFQRILRTPKWAVILFNERLVDVSPFLQAYEALLKKHSPDYATVDHRRITPDMMRAFFGPSLLARSYPNHQSLDLPALKGRLLSSSYAPKSGPAHDAMLAELESLFATHQSAGHIDFNYQTLLYAAQLP